MPNNFDINSKIGDLKTLNAEIVKLTNNIGKLLEVEKNLTSEISKSKGQTDLNKKVNEVKSKQNEIEEQRIKLTKESNKLLAAQDESLRELNKQVIKERIEKKKLNDAIKEEITGEKKAAEIKKQRIAAAKRAAEAAKKETKGITNLIVELRREIKTEKEANEQNKQLLKTRKELDTTTAKGRKQISLINKQIDKNNALIKENASEIGKQKMNIDNYASATEGLKGKIGQATDFLKGFVLQFAAIGTAAQVGLQLAKSFFTGSQRGADALKVKMAGLKAQVDFLTNSMGQLGETTLESADDGKVSMGELFDVVMLIAKSRLFGVEKAIELELIKIAAEELQKTLNEVTRAEIENSATLEELANKTELYKMKSDDATLSFQAREEFAKLAFKAESERLNLSLELAEKSFNAYKESTDRIIAQGQTLNNEQLKLLKDYEIAYINALSNQEKAQEEHNKRLRDLRLDDFEQELDFIFDVADKRKTANEKIIADTRIAFNERKKLLEETNNLLDESFDAQIDLFEKENELQIDRNKLLNLNNKESFEYARSLGMSERATNRLLEVIRERIAATSDLEDATKNLREEETKINKVSGKDIDSILSKQKIERATKTEELITDEVVNGLAERYQANLDYLAKVEAAEEQSIEMRKQLRQQLISSAIDLGNTLFDLGQSRRDRELESIQNNYQAQIAAAEGNTERQEQLAAQLADEQKRINIQQAKSERNQALFNLAINTAQKAFEIKAQAAVLGSNPATVALVPLALTQLGLLLGTSALQAGLIASQPLPGFFQGTEDAPGGLAWLAEKGNELIHEPDGKTWLAENKGIYDLKEHSKVIPHEQTQQILNSSIMNDIAINGNKGLEDRIDELIYATKNQPREVTSFDDQGIQRYLMSGNSKVNYLNRKGK